MVIRIDVFKVVTLQEMFPHSFPHSCSQDTGISRPHGDPHPSMTRIKSGQWHREWSVGWLMVMIKEGSSQELQVKQRREKREGKDLGGRLFQVKKQQGQGP